MLILNFRATSMFVVGILACMMFNHPMRNTIREPAGGSDTGGKSESTSSRGSLFAAAAASSDVNVPAAATAASEDSKQYETSPFGDFLLPSSRTPVVIGVAGGSGSGKTTMARAIVDAIGADKITVISHDSYYKNLSHLSIDERETRNFDHPNALDTHLLIEHLQQLKSGAGALIPTYDFNTHSRLEATEEIFPRPVILVEGILIFSDPALVELIDIKLFVDTDSDIRIIRRIQRDIVERGRTAEKVIEQYLKTVRPMHLQFVEPSKKNADIIVPEGLNIVALDLIVSKLKLTISEALEEQQQQQQQPPLAL